MPKHSLHTLNCIRIPDGADDAGVRNRLLADYGIEIGAGLGVMAGKPGASDSWAMVRPSETSTLCSPRCGRFWRSQRLIAEGAAQGR